MFEAPEVGEILQAAMPKLKAHIEDIVQMQYDTCMKKGFHLKKYYIWFLYYRRHDNGKIVFRPAICRSTRPSPYQDEDMFLWSVTDYDHIQFEWAIPKKETISNVLANPHMFDKDYVKMLRDYVNDKLESFSDYLVEGKAV